VEFAGEMFDSMRRKDQRRWGEVYLRGLMLDGKRKSIEPMAARLDDGDEQCLQQFVSQSPWDWQPVRRALAVRVSAEIGPEAWIVDDTGFPKFGKMSVGVARQYFAALGKVGNCQLGVSINAASEQASCPLDWRLFIPEEWDEDFFEEWTGAYDGYHAEVEEILDLGSGGRLRRGSSERSSPCEYGAGHRRQHRKRPLVG